MAKISELQKRAMFIAMVIRNELDFAGEYLSDEQSQLVRDAIYTALYAREQARRGSVGAKMFIEYNSTLPSYWDPPKLTEDYRDVAELVMEEAGGTPVGGAPVGGVPVGEVPAPELEVA
jgi:hypothetical protein